MEEPRVTEHVNLASITLAKPAKVKRTAPQACHALRGPITHSDGCVESRRQTAREKTVQKHLSEDVLGFRRSRPDSTGTDHFGNRHGVHGLALHGRKPVETVLAHQRCLPYVPHRARRFSAALAQAMSRPAHPLKLRNTKQAPPARRMRLQRSSAAGRVSAPIRTW